jgi:hypothetical protein
MKLNIRTSMNTILSSIQKDYDITDGVVAAATAIVVDDDDYVIAAASSSCCC